MKQLLTLLALVILSGLPAVAQTDSLSEAYSRIKMLENQLQQQNTQISKLSADVNEVLNQNLALKKNLNLQPTIAQTKSGDLEYRLISLTGDPVKNTVHGIIMVENTGLSEVHKNYPYPTIIDENGAKYDTSSKFKAHFKEDTNSLNFSIKSYPVKTPLQIEFTLEGVDPNTQYFKYFAIRHNVGDDAIFQNLPIKWTAE